MTATWTPGSFTAIYEYAFTGPEERRVDGALWGVWAVTRDEPRACWTVVHVPSGLSVGEFHTEPIARGYCEEIAPLMDWSTVRTLADVPVKVMTRAKRVRMAWGGS